MHLTLPEIGVGISAIGLIVALILMFTEED